jgi:hypothetical protein
MYKNTPRGRFRAQLLGPACPRFFGVVLIMERGKMIKAISPG